MGLIWLDKLGIELQGNKNTSFIQNINADERREKILDEYEDLFKNNHTIEGLTIIIELEKKYQTDLTKRKTSAHRFQGLVCEKRHLEKTDETTENCFVSPTVVTIKKDILVKIALDSRKLTESCIKRKATMPNMEELISKIAANVTRNDGEF